MSRVKHKFSIIVVLVILFIGANVTVYYMTGLNIRHKIEPILTNHIKNIRTHYEALLYHQKELANLMYQSTIEIPEVIEILSKLQSPISEDEKTRLRDRLYDRLLPKYRRMRAKGVLQYHFVLKDNTTFLRMHKPNRYNDDLSEVRYSFRYVNETHKIFRGFDQGRTTHAFRNIYPIFDANGTYLCALDISFPSEVLQAYLTEIGNVHSHLLVNRNIFSVKSWKRKDFALKYFPSAEHNEYMLTMTTEHTKERCITQNRVKLANLRDEIDEKIAKQDGFAIYYEDDDKAKVVTFYPIKEEERGTTVVWIVSYEDDYMIATALEFNRLLRVTLFFLFMLLGYFIYTILTQKNILDIQVKEELRKNRQKDTHMLHQSRLAQMGEMMSMVAHQWRQPLSAISSTSTAIGVKAKINKLDNETAINLSDKILEYVEHLSNTINDFRDFFKPNRERVDIGYTEIVTSVLNIIETSVRNKHIELELDLNSTISIYIYPNEAKQVILNLIQNAEDALLEKKIENPKIIIETNDNVLTISDNAGGVPEDIIEHIFEPYFSSKKSRDGTGLGLYMSRTIIEEHCGGELTVSNSDVGAVFRIVLDRSIKQIRS